MGDSLNIENKNKIRESNFELLRIVAMFIIIMSHCDEIFGLSTLYMNTLGANKIITDLLHIGGQIGVGCFLLISAYFLVDQKFSLKRLLRVIGEVLFYNITIYLIWLIKHSINGDLVKNIAIEKAVYSFLPITFTQYWFVTAYIILIILAPFLNKLIDALSKKDFQILLAILIVVFVILGGAFPKGKFITTKVMNGMFDGRIYPVFIYYFIGAYIKRFRTERKNNAWVHLIISLIAYLLLFGVCYLMTYIGIKENNKTALNNMYFYRNLNSPFVVIICIELFLCFLEIKIKPNKFINIIASSTFGIYLIHNNRIMLAEVLPRIFPIYKVTNSLIIFAYSIAAVLTIFITCCLIDLLRKYIIAKPLNKVTDKLLPKLEMKFKAFCNAHSKKTNQ